MSNQKWQKELRALGRDEPKIEHSDALDDELFTQGSDRATGVLLGSFVERSLERLIIKNLRSDLGSADRDRLFGIDGSASAFSNKISLAYAMSVIGQSTKTDLDLIRLIRNAYAHSLVPSSFSTPTISEACKHFLIFNLPGILLLPLAYKKIRPDLSFDMPSSMYDSKTRFIVACFGLLSRMAMKRDGFQPGDHAFPGDDPLP